jgi:hypothetical protein
MLLQHISRLETLALRKIGLSANLSLGDFFTVFHKQSQSAAMNRFGNTDVSTTKNQVVTKLP